MTKLHRRDGIVSVEEDPHLGTFALLWLALVRTARILLRYLPVRVRKAKR